MQRALRELIIGTARRIVGRNYLFRVSEALSLAARSETENRPDVNGERDVQRAVIGATPPGDELIVVDVGANLGQWTSEIVRLRGDHRLRVYAFEPAPEIANALEQRLADFRDCVTVVRVAASETDGTTQFFFRPDNPLVSSVVDIGDANTEGISVRTMRLDTFAEEQGLERIHFLKIDAEGFDMPVLLGASRLLREQRIDVVQFEYNFRWIYARHFLRDAFELLEPLGFRIGKVTPKGVEFYARWQPIMEIFHDSNFVACSPEWQARLPRVSPPWPE